MWEGMVTTLIETGQFHPLTDAEAKLLDQVAKHASAKWPRVSHGEVKQELWVWALRNFKWVEKYRDPISEPHGKGKLNKSLWKAATTACVSEEAAIRGKRKDQPLMQRDSDYNRDVVRTLLSVVWSPEDWPQALAKAVDTSVMGMGSYGSSFTEVYLDDGHYSQAEQARDMLMDVSNAVSRLNKRDQVILRLAFGECVRSSELADTLNCSVDAAWKAKERALDKLLRFL
jgi:DNA-binding CsgD family transcriptional regulator